MRAYFVIISVNMHIMYMGVYTYMCAYVYMRVYIFLLSNYLKGYFMKIVTTGSVQYPAYLLHIEDF